MNNSYSNVMDSREALDELEEEGLHIKEYDIKRDWLEHKGYRENIGEQINTINVSDSANRKINFPGSDRLSNLISWNSNQETADLLARSKRHRDLQNRVSKSDGNHEIRANLMDSYEQLEDTVMNTIQTEKDAHTAKINEFGKASAAAIGTAAGLALISAYGVDAVDDISKPGPVEAYEKVIELEKNPQDHVKGENAISYREAREKVDTEIDSIYNANDVKNRAELKEKAERKEFPKSKIKLLGGALSLMLGGIGTFISSIPYHEWGSRRRKEELEDKINAEL